MKTIFKNSLGFTMVGTLVASAIGAVAVLGLARLSSNIINTLNKARKDTNIMELSQDIKKVFQEGHDPNCDTHINDCWNACTSSLIGYSTSSGGSIAIKEQSPLATGMGAGPERYKGGELYKGIQIQEIRYAPSSIPKRADVTVHFSISDDTRETLTAPQGLHFGIFIDEESSSGTIERCTVASAEITGSGAIGVVKDCRKVGMGRTLVGCGGTTDNNSSKATAFGYRAGKDSKAGTGGSGVGTSFLGYEAGKKNEGDENIFIGYQAGLENKEGKGNLFLGYKAGHNNTKGIYNVVIGKEMEVPDGAEERDRLNIVNVIDGKFRNEAVFSAPHDDPSEPEVTIKWPVKIAPPPHASSTGLRLFILGELDIQRRQHTPVGARIKIKADNYAAPPFHHPLMTLMAPTLRFNGIDFKVQGTEYDTELELTENLKVFGATTVDGGSDPGLTSHGDLELTSRDSTKGSITVKTIGGPKLQVGGDLTVKGEGTGSTSTIKQDLTVGRNLFVEGQGTLDYLELPNDGTAKFGTLKVDGVATIPQIRIGTAEFETTITGISKAGINSLDGGDGHLSHIHPSGPAALNANRTPNHNHDSQYSQIGHSHSDGWHPPNRCLLSCHPQCKPQCSCGFCTCNPTAPACTSSRTLKRNIKPFKDYEKSLKDIADTPLFTWQYKKDNKEHYPDKVRMGFISEKLPKDLQIIVKSDPDAKCETGEKPKDQQAKDKKTKKKKDKEKISTPDMLSIYGTLWAGIKAFAKQLDDFKKENAVKLTELSKELKTHLADQIALLKKEITSQLKSLKNQVAETEKALEKQSREITQNTRELSELKKQFQKNFLPLQNNWQEELKKTREEMDSTQEQLKQNLSLHPDKKPSLEARSN